MIWTYTKISIASGVFWAAVVYFILPSFALLSGSVAFVVTFCMLAFNYGAH